MIGRSLIVATVVVGLCGQARGAAAHDPFGWAPAYAFEVARGKQTAARFGLLSLYEVSVEVDNVFAAANRQALTIAEQRIAEVPGVRAVFGPASLLDISVDAGGKTGARPVLARGQTEIDGEAARQRVVRRADAVGWYLTENGGRARFLVDTDDWPRVAPGVANALATSGLALAPASGPPDARPLWPDPGRRGRWLPVALPAVWVFFVLIALGRARSAAWRESGTRRFAMLLAAASGAAAPFVLVPIDKVRVVGALAALGGALVSIPFWRKRRPDAAPQTSVRGPARALILTGLLLVVVGAALSPRLRVATRQWGAAPMFFVSVRGDMDEPVVLREVRRLTDYLRERPGVANAWSVADLFAGVSYEGEETSRIPDDADLVRRVLVQARTDPAVRLELAGDHREALVGVRFDEDATVASDGRLALVADLQRYANLALRRSLAHVDVRSGGVPPATRSLGRSLLAVDARERVLRICARSGRVLTPTQALSVERVARQAATIPAADPGRLDTEVSESIGEFVGRHPFPLPAVEAGRLIAAVGALGEEGTVDDVRVAVAAAYGSRLPEPILRTTGTGLHKRVSQVRRRHIARTNFRDMLYGAELPTEGVLADEVRAATLEAMGPLVGIPVPPETPSAFKLDVVAVGGAANDRELSEAWHGALRAGVVGSIGLIMIALIIAGGPAGTLSLPLAFAPLAVAATPAALLGEAIGLPTIAFFGGALAGGAVFAVATVRPRRRR